MLRPVDIVVSGKNKEVTTPSCKTEDGWVFIYYTLARKLTIKQ